MVPTSNRLVFGCLFRIGVSMLIVLVALPYVALKTIITEKSRYLITIKGGLRQFVRFNEHSRIYYQVI